MSSKQPKRSEILSDERRTALMEQKSSTGRRFLRFKPPTGNTFYSYAIKFLSETRQVESKRWIDQQTNKPRIETHADIVLVEIKPDDGFGKAGTEYRISMSANMLRKLENSLPLTDKTFAVCNKGKPQGKTFYEYAVLPVEGTLTLDVLDQLFRQ